MIKKSKFALFFGNRGFFPASLQTSARRQMKAVLTKQGHDVLMLDSRATRNGAVETVKEGRIYADFLQKHQGEFDGVILSLPNFGDENGAVAAMAKAGVPILVQAFPDELNRMGPAHRRDSYCGKLSIMDLFVQNNIPFTALQPHVVHPESETFAANLDHFDRMCRVVKGMKNMVVGAIGARTSAFKTVRIDELTLQKFGITVETFDLSDIFLRASAVKTSGRKAEQKAARLKKYTTWKNVPRKAFSELVKLGVAVDDVVKEHDLDAVAIRCWLEMQQQIGISPCVLLSEMNDRGKIAACEVDIGSAVAMYALRLASGNAAACLDWNNNFGEEPDKCILFHCGSAPQSMMQEKGKITDHAILANAVGAACTFGCNVGRIKAGSFTFGNLLTRDGRMEFYLGEGAFTDDALPPEYFGCAGVAQIPDLQQALQTIGYAGHRHHVSITPGHVLAPVLDAFERYLGYTVTRL